MQSELATLVENLASRRVVVLGDLVADHYVFGQTDRVSREAPVLVVRYETSEVKLGGGANAAANVRSLGGQVTAVGALGLDPMGDALHQELARAGIEAACEDFPGIKTETKMRILAGGLNTSRQQMLRVDRGNRPPLPEALERGLARRLEEASHAADAILVSDYGAGVCNSHTRAVLQAAVARGVPVCVDSRYGLLNFSGMTLCKPNEPELETLTQVPILDDASLSLAAARGLELLECQALLVTRGQKGMALFLRSGEAHLIPVHGAKEAVDVTGAGDTVIATFTLALAAGASTLQAARLANVAGALVVQKQGTATLSKEELLAELQAS